MIMQTREKVERKSSKNRRKNFLYKKKELYLREESVIGVIGVYDSMVCVIVTFFDDGKGGNV